MASFWSTFIFAMLLSMHSSCYSEHESLRTAHESAITSSQDHLSHEISSSTSEFAQNYQSALRASRAYLDGESRQIIDLLLNDGEILTPQSRVMHDAMKGSTVYLRLASTQSPEDLDRQIYRIAEIIAIPGEDSWIQSWSRSDALKFFSPVPINFELAAQVYLRTQILFVAQTTDNGLRNMFDSRETEAFLLQAESSGTTTVVGGESKGYSDERPEGQNAQSIRGAEAPPAFVPCRETGSCQGVCRQRLDDPIACCEEHFGVDAVPSCSARFWTHCYNQKIEVGSHHPKCYDISIGPTIKPPKPTDKPQPTPFPTESALSCGQHKIKCFNQCCWKEWTCRGSSSFPYCTDSWGLPRSTSRPCPQGNLSCRPLIGKIRCCEQDQLCGLHGCYRNPSYYHSDLGISPGPG
jgi:hypothetical protein